MQNFSFLAESILFFFTVQMQKAQFRVICEEDPQVYQNPQKEAGCQCFIP